MLYGRWPMRCGATSGRPGTSSTPSAPARLPGPAAQAAQWVARTTPAADLRGVADDLAQPRAVRERAVKDVRDINDNTDL